MGRISDFFRGKDKKGKKEKGGKGGLSPDILGSGLARDAARKLKEKKKKRKKVLDEAFK